ncbi:uncharacterized mitochondrial protein-like protein [Tanacetum coccineum]
MFGINKWYQSFALRNFDLEETIKKNPLLTRKRWLLWLFQTLRKNEVLFSEEVAVLKREVACKNYEINVLKSELKKVEQEKDGIDFKIEKFDKASKDLDQLLGSQITDKNKKGLGYSAVPPPHPLIYNRPNKLDLSYYGLDEFKESEFKGYGPENSKQESNVVDKEIVFPVDKKVEFTKPKRHEKLVKKSVRQVNTARPKAVVNAVRTNRVNVVKASACWVWRPVKPNSASITLKRYDYVDARGRSRNYQEEPFTHKEEMAFSDSEVHNDKPCTKSCLKNYETLKKQYDDLLAKLHQTEFKASTYKRGLDTVEAQLVTYRKNEVLFSEEVAVLKREVGCKTYEFNMLKTEFEKVKQEKEGIDFKIEKFENASKDLDKLLGSQITDNSKKGLGYHAVPPPHPLIYNAPTKLDLSYSGLEEFKQPEFEGYGVKVDKSVCEKSSKEIKKTPDAPIIEDWESDSDDEKKPKSKVEKKIGVSKTVSPTVSKIEFVRPKQQEKLVRKPVKYAKMYRSQRPRGNQRNWNNQKSQQLGNDFVMHNKACYVCGSFDHLQYTCKQKRQLNWNGQKSNQLDTKCLVLSPNFKLPDENQILLKIPRKTYVTVFDIRPISKESFDLSCAKATTDESMLWHKRLGFKDPDHPDKVYKVVKALYGLHQAPRAWYETLANYLLSNGFNRVYVDDIIFGSTNKELCTGFEKLMKDKFQMSSMGELTFFLGLQVQQKEDGIFISQDKYVAEILKKFNYSDVKSASTPVDLEKKPFHVTPKTSHLLAVKRIFRYLKGKPTLGLWYSRDSPFELDAYTDSDYAGATLDREVQQLEVCQFLGKQVDHSYGSEKANCGSDLQKEKYAQAKENAAFEKEIQRRVDSSKDQESLGVPEDASKQGRSIADIDADVKQLTTKSPRDRGWLFRSQEKDQIALDEQIARDIQAKLDVELLEEQKLVRKQEEEANIVLIESWENTQAIMEADRLLAERLKSKEREELTDEKKQNCYGK